MHRIIILIVVIFKFVSESFGATHYVSPSGSASWANSTDIGQPCSISTAMSNAVADDVVYLRGGTYSYTGNPAASYHAVYEPTNQGAPGHPITFIAYTGETPTFSVNWGNNSETGWILGSGGKDYITFSGITVQTSDPDENAGFWLGSDDDGDHAIGVIVTECTITGGSTQITSDDNYDLNRMENCDYCEFSYNAVGPFPGGTGGADNYSCLKLYHNNYADIRNNEWQHCEENAISSKSYLNNSTIRYNFFLDCTVAYRQNLLGAGYECDDNEFYGNIVANATATGSPLWYYADASGNYADNLNIYNNTIYTPSSDPVALHSSPGLDIYNNILLHKNSASFMTVRAATTIDTMDHNQFGTATFLITIDYYNPTTYTSLSAWQSSGELVGSGNPGVGSLASDPQFVTASGNRDTIAEFELDTGSPCLSTGRLGADMGADISLVGIGVEAEAPTPTAQGITSSGVSMQ